MNWNRLKVDFEIKYQIHINKLLEYSKCIKVYEMSTSDKQSFLIVIEFQVMSQIRIIQHYWFGATTIMIWLIKRELRPFSHTYQRNVRKNALCVFTEHMPQNSHVYGVYSIWYWLLRRDKNGEVETWSCRRLAYVRLYLGDCQLKLFTLHASPHTNLDTSTANDQTSSETSLLCRHDIKQSMS